MKQATTWTRAAPPPVGERVDVMVGGVRYPAVVEECATRGMVRVTYWTVEHGKRKPLNTMTIWPERLLPHTDTRPALDDPLVQAAAGILRGGRA